MQNKDSVDIVERFFLAIDSMKRDRIIGGLSPFCVKYSIDRRNLYQLKKDKSRDIFQVSWLFYLVRDFGVSADWLLTGNGNLYRKKPQENRKNVKCE